MNLIDSSAWIDYLRGNDGAACDEVRRLLTVGEPVATTEPVVMELLAGAPTERSLHQLRSLTYGLPLLSVDNGVDYADAAVIYREVRRSGRTVRRLLDCLVAAVALRHEATLVHKDADFEAIAAVVPLRDVSLR